MRKNAYAAKQAEYAARFHAIDAEARETVAAMRALAEDDGVPLTCMCDDPSVVSKVERLRAKLPPGRPRVLYVDDEEPNLRAFELAFEDRLDVMLAQNAESALRMLSLYTPDAALVDVKMPGMPGPDLAREIARRWPEIKVYLITAYSPDVGPGPWLKVLTKPWTDSAVLSAVGA